MDIDTLNRRFGVPNQLRFVQGPEGFTIIEIENFHARATVCLQGAQILTFQPRDHEPVLWVSKAARYIAGKSIRGGVPVCWPWFGPHATDTQKPAHGYARSAMWRVVEASALNDGATRLTLELETSAANRTVWPHESSLQLHVSVGPTLMIEMVTRNDSTQAINITEALHTYFHISDIEGVNVTGLDGCAYIDKVAGGAAVQQGPVRMNGETDRVYLNTETECVIHDPALRRRIHIGKSGSRSTVVWNPWTEKALKLGDMGENGFRQMVCVETANALDNDVTIPAGKEHRMVKTIRVERS